jgi:hypothetical protein
MPGCEKRNGQQRGRKKSYGERKRTVKGKQDGQNESQGVVPENGDEIMMIVGITAVNGATIMATGIENGMALDMTIDVLHVETDHEHL